MLFIIYKLLSLTVKSLENVSNCQTLVRRDHQNLYWFGPRGTISM